MTDQEFFNFINVKYNVSRETFNKLIIYKNLLFKWQNTINLVSRGTLEKFWNRHILDSLQIIDYINGNNILDIGSGAGFPGMVLALCGDFNVTCIDSDSRKMIFLEEVARQTSRKVNILTKRIEDFTHYDFETVCSRGFSSLTALIKLTKKHTKENYGVFLKGVKIYEEIEEAKQNFNFKYTMFDSITDKSGKVIIVEQISYI